jgi:hypothetical protein
MEVIKPMNIEQCRTEERNPGPVGEDMCKDEWGDESQLQGLYALKMLENVESPVGGFFGVKGHRGGFIGRNHQGVGKVWLAQEGRDGSSHPDS